MELLGCRAALGTATRHRPVEDLGLTSVGATGATVGSWMTDTWGGAAQVGMAAGVDEGTQGPQRAQLAPQPRHPSQAVQRHPASGPGPSTEATSPEPRPSSNPPAPSNVGTPTISSECLAIKLQAEGLEVLP